MRRYDDPVEVRKGPEESPEQFLWRGKLWKVRAVLAHWVETGSWWQSADARAVLGTDDYAVVEPGEPVSRPGDRTGDLLGERELWRVEAGDNQGGGVFDLSFDWADGSWQLVGCVD
jgi:hypothetical protein